MRGWFLLSRPLFRPSSRLGGRASFRSHASHVRLGFRTFATFACMLRHPMVREGRSDRLSFLLLFSVRCVWYSFARVLLTMATAAASVSPAGMSTLVMRSPFALRWISPCAVWKNFCFSTRSGGMSMLIVACGRTNRRHEGECRTAWDGTTIFQRCSRFRWIRPKVSMPSWAGKTNKGTNRCHMEDPSVTTVRPCHHGLGFVPSIPPIFRSFHGMVASILDHPFFHPSIHSMSMHPPCLVLGPVLVGYPVAHEGVPRVGPTCFLFVHPPRPFLPLPWVACLCSGGWNAPSLHLEREPSSQHPWSLY